jgi:hypothetical protein
MVYIYKQKEFASESKDISNIDVGRLDPAPPWPGAVQHSGLCKSLAYSGQQRMVTAYSTTARNTNWRTCHLADNGDGPRHSHPTTSALARKK